MKSLDREGVGKPVGQSLALGHIYWLNPGNLWTLQASLVIRIVSHILHPHRHVLKVKMRSCAGHFDLFKRSKWDRVYRTTLFVWKVCKILYQPSLFIYINKMFSVTSSLLSPVFNYGEGIQSRRMSSPGVVYLQQVALLVEAQVARGEVPALRK